MCKDCLNKKKEFFEVTSENLMKADNNLPDIDFSGICIVYKNGQFGVTALVKNLDEMNAVFEKMAEITLIEILKKFP